MATHLRLSHAGIAQHEQPEQHESLVHELLVLAIASGACNTQDMLLMSTGGVQDGVERM